MNNLMRRNFDIHTTLEERVKILMFGEPSLSVNTCVMLEDNILKKFSRTILYMFPWKYTQSL